jgi:N-acetylneuraminic acid mutarotase
MPSRATRTLLRSPARIAVAAAITGTLSLAGATFSAAGPVGAAPASPSGASNTFVPTAGPMSVARAGQTATLLPDGRVLVVGGASAAADLYDPSTGTFSATASMSTVRPGATATLLPDGKVLVAGGCCHGSSNLSSAELYDTSTGTWSATGSMVHPRSYQTAMLLPDGQVLVAGGACNGTAYGCDSGSSLVNQISAELYDPATGTWSATGSMHAGRDLATATLLKNGKVLVAGGFNNCDDSFCSDLAESELYDPATRTWTRTGNLPTPVEQQTATLLENGFVLVAGGLNEGGFGRGGVSAGAALYDPATGTWTATSPMPAGHYGQAANLLKNGWVLVEGGQSATAEIYEPARGVWVQPGALSTPRTGASATVLGDGDVLVAGGNGPNGLPQSTAEIYVTGPGPLVRVMPGSLGFVTEVVGSTGNPQAYTVTNEGTASLQVSGVAVSGSDPSDFSAANTCTASPLIPGASCSVTTRFAPTSTGKRTAEVAVADNAPLSPQGAAVSGYGSGPNSFAPTGSMAIARNGDTATLLEDGEVLIAGGQRGPGARPLSESELYDPATGVFTATGSLATGRANATATLLPDGDVLVAGGKGANSVNLSSAELFDPTTDTWSATTPMNGEGYYLTSTLLPTGNVLVDGLGFGETAEVYDPMAQTWTDTAPTSVSSFLGTATLLPDGQVLVAGGGNASAALYDPATNTWTATGSMHVARQDPTATLLPSGQVLVVGGVPPGGGNPLTSAELYDPSTGVWSVTGSLSIGRDGATATLLPDGVVMVSGGCIGSCGPATTTTELYSDGFFSFGPSMTQRRDAATATLLANGDVLMAGGGTSYCCAVTATAEIYTSPHATVTPGSGPAGTAVTITGTGFYAGEVVKVSDDVVGIGRATTNSAGTFDLSTTIPATAPVGANTIRVAGQRSFATALATFTVS